MTRRLDTQAKRASRLPRIGNIGGLYERYDGICHLCRTKVAIAEASRDHRIPVVNGGSDRKYNIALAHKDCNVARADLPMAEVEAALERWSELHPDRLIRHFQCVEVLRIALEEWRARPKVDGGLRDA